MRRLPGLPAATGLGLLALLLIGLSPVAGARLQDDTLPEDVYWQRLEESLNTLSGLENADPGLAHTLLEAEAIRWEYIRGVRLPDGTIAAVDGHGLAARLRQDPPPLRAIESHLRQALAARPAFDAGAAARADADLRSLERVLQDPAFRWTAGTEEPTPIQQAIEDLLARLASLMEPVVQAPGLGLLIGLVGSLALLLVVGLALRGLVGSLVDQEAIDVPGDWGLEVLTSDEALRQAQESSAGGDYRTAVRYLYLSTLLLLEERGLLAYDRSRTNREYLQSIAHVPEAASLFKDIVDVFDSVWYGYHTLDAATYERYQSAVRRLQKGKFPA